MEKKRARRRRDLLRMKTKAIRIYGRLDIPGAEKRRHAKLADHMATCSGWCCGNPRKWFGKPTMQERKFMAEKIGSWSR